MKRFQPGDEVRLLYDIKNDGTVYGGRRGDVIARAGATGFISGSGYFLGEIVYDVRFLETDRVVGLREKELAPAAEKWSPAGYEKGDMVRAVFALRHGGRIVADAEAKGTITAVRHHGGHGYVYETRFDGAGVLVVVTEKQISRAVHR